MGTRSLTTIIEKYDDTKSGKEKQIKIVTVYQQFDGYPTGVGLELAKFLESGTIINGIADQKGKLFNGSGCLAAQLVAEFKDGPGGLYLKRGGTINCWEDYRYEIICKDVEPIIFKCYVIHKKPKLLFEGSPADFIKLVEENGNDI